MKRLGDCTKEELYKKDSLVALPPEVSIGSISISQPVQILLFLDGCTLQCVKGEKNY